MKKTTLFNHLGLPIKLIDWPHVEVDGQLVPDVNYVKLEALMFMLLPYKPTRLSGAEIKFIRHHLGITQKKFAKWLVDEADDSTVAVWEKAGLDPTCMQKAMERSLRFQLIGLGLHKQNRTTIKLNDVMGRLSSGLSTKKSNPMNLRAEEY